MAEEGFIAHWQRVAMNPDSAHYTFARHVTDTRKVVFSKTLDKATPIPGGWDNADIVAGDFVNEINKLKQLYRNDILIYGGATFACKSCSSRERQKEQDLIFNLYYWQDDEVMVTRSELNTHKYNSLKSLGIEVSIPTIEIMQPAPQEDKKK